MYPPGRQEPHPAYRAALARKAQRLHDSQRLAYAFPMPERPRNYHADLICLAVLIGLAGGYIAAVWTGVVEGWEQVAEVLR